MNFFKRIPGPLLGFFGCLTLIGLTGASYGVFSPGGALSGTWNSQNVNLAAGGSFITGVTPVANGGTNLSAASDDNAMVGNGTTWQSKAITSCSGATDAVTYNTTTNAFGCNTISAGGTPGGATTNVQYNNAGAFGGSAKFFWDDANTRLSIGDSVTPAVGEIRGVRGTSATTSAGLALNIVGGPGGTTSGGGGAVNIQGGVPVDGTGGSVSVAGFPGVGTNRGGGGVTINGSGATGSGAGGIAQLTAGAGGATGTAGAVTIAGGAGGTTSGAGGQVNINGGLPTDGNGGGIFVTGRNAVGTNRSGGVISAQAGNATGSGTAGTVSIAAGAAGTTGDGGSSSIVAGTATDGNGGSIVLTAQNGTGTNRSGGNINITAGTPTGSGVAGALVLTGLTATGAQIATFTAANKPGSGTTTPSLWLRIVVGGTTYYVPMWQ